MFIRVCPKRDAVCPYGMLCAYSIDRYECRPEPGEATDETVRDAVEVGVVPYRERYQGRY